MTPRVFLKTVVIGTTSVLLLTACPEPPRPYRSGGSMTLNFSPDYIHYYSIASDFGFQGGGPNVDGMEPGAPYPAGGGAERCCTVFPRQWQPDMVVTVRWLVNREREELFYIAQVTVPHYGDRTGVVFAIFFPGDRVRLKVQDGSADPMGPYADDDPFIAQGVRDEETHRARAEQLAAQEARRKWLKEKEKEWAAEREKLPSWEEVMRERPSTFLDGPP
jgi:hypothetical protein